MISEEHQKKRNQGEGEKMFWAVPSEIKMVCLLWWIFATNRGFISERQIRNLLDGGLFISVVDCIWLPFSIDINQQKEACKSSIQAVKQHALTEMKRCLRKAGTLKKGNLASDMGSC